MKLKHLYWFYPLSAGLFVLGYKKIQGMTKIGRVTLMLIAGYYGHKSIFEKYSAIQKMETRKLFQKKADVYRRYKECGDITVLGDHFELFELERKKGDVGE